MTTRITEQESAFVLANDARWARSLKERRQGLIGSPPLKPGQALIIDATFQVHTFQMDFPIDVVFCDKNWVVRHMVRSMVPRRVSRLVPSARYAIELPAGTIPTGFERRAQLTVTQVAET